MTLGLWLTADLLACLHTAKNEREPKARPQNGVQYRHSPGGDYNGRTHGTSALEATGSLGSKQPLFHHHRLHHFQQQQQQQQQQRDPRSDGAAECSSSGPADPGLARQLSDTGEE
jgi:hypothetical protein